MNILPDAIEELIDGIAALPGIGPKSASRMAFFLLKAPKEMSDNLSKVISQARGEVKYCKECYHYSQDDLCPVCVAEGRNKNLIMVVEDALDLLAIENTGGFDGVYFVLGGILSPMNGVGPEEIRIKELLEKLISTKNGEIELIIGLNPNMEGESTALYIQKEIQDNEVLNSKVKITKLARGLSSGADIDYLDEYTIKKAFEGRSEL